MSSVSRIGEKFSCPGCESLFDFHQNNLSVAFQDGGWVGRLFVNEGLSTTGTLAGLQIVSSRFLGSV